MTPLNRLVLGAGGANAADQIVVTALPLTAAAIFGFGPEAVAWLVAVQSGAWLVTTAPAGTLLDRHERRKVLAAAGFLSALALLAATLAIRMGWIPLLAASIFFAAIGTIVSFLGSMALAPELAEPGRLAPANARLELARGIASTAAPLLAGPLVRAGWPEPVFLLAALASALAGVAALSLPPQKMKPVGRPGFVSSLTEGTAFVLGQPILRALAVCALFWNFAFFALTAIFASWSLDRLGLDPREAGWALSAFGFGLILAALTASRVLAATSPGAVLLAGPVMSTAGALAIWGADLAGGGVGALAMASLGWFLLGYLPMVWAVTQTTLRQIVTPPERLGRVGATLQLAVYGVRPIGALAGGWVAKVWGMPTALACIAALFACAATSVAFSPLPALKRFPEKGEF